MNSLKGIVLMTAILFCVGIGSGWSATNSKFTAEQFIYRELHDKGIYPNTPKRSPELRPEDRYDVKVALGSYKLAEDEDTETKKALAIKLNKQFVQKSDFWVLKTPRLGDLDVGTYRVTVRMKVQGMLNSLGSAVAIQAGNQTREVWMNEFLEENVYQEFSLDFDSRESDLVTKRDAQEYYFWRDFGSVQFGGGARFKEELPEIDEQLQRNEKPRLDRFSYWLAQWYLTGLTTNLPPENDPNRKAVVKSETQKYAAIIQQEILKSEGRALEFKKDAKDHPLPEQVVTWINQHGRLQPDGTVLLYFPVNITGKGIFKSSRGPTTPQPTLRLLTVDWIKIEKLPEPDNIVVREVDCRRAWCRPGETQTISAWLHNRSGKDQTNKFRLLLRTGLDREATLLEKDYSIKQGTYERLEWPWPIPTNQHLWGQTVVAQILKADQVVSEERTWFALHPSAVAVMIHDRANAARFLHPYAQRPPQVNNQSETQGSYCESQGVTPPKDKLWDLYVSSFGRAVHSMAGLYAVSKGLRQQGIAPFMYVCGGSMGAGAMGFELFWEHPDWVQEIPANSDDFLIERRRTEDLALKYYRGEYKTTNNAPPEISRSGGAYAGELVYFNCLVDEVVKPLFETLPLLLENTGYIAPRYDGTLFNYASNIKVFGGTWGKTPEELRQHTVMLTRRFKAEMKARFPAHACYANAGVALLQTQKEDPYDFDQAYRLFVENDPAQVEFVKDDGGVMEEMWMAYATYGHFLNNCRNYLRAAHYENAAFKMAGGHNGHMLWYYDEVSHYTPDEIYQQVFSFLSGCHLTAAFGPIPESVHDLGVYATCFSEFFWDTALRPIYAMADKVSTDAEADLWVTETGFQKVNERGNLIYVIPVINPPATEIWLQNRFGLLPAPIREPFGITVKIPEGYKRAVNVYQLANAPCPQVKKLTFQATDKDVTFQLPELLVFEVAVVEFAK